MSVSISQLVIIHHTDVIRMQHPPGLCNKKLQYLLLEKQTLETTKFTRFPSQKRLFIFKKSCSSRLIGNKRCLSSFDTSPATLKNLSKMLHVVVMKRKSLWEMEILSIFNIAIIVNFTIDLLQIGKPAITILLQYIAIDFLDSKPLFHRWSHLSLRCSWVTSSTKLLVLGANPATSGKQPATWRREFRNTPDQPAMWEVTWGTARKRCKMLMLTLSTEPIATPSYSLWKPFTYPGERRPSTRRRNTGRANSLWECDLSLFR